ncbi:hypothetical protein BJY00DRAFT_314692 [Aspergillus carlsbadensis]|nr:hypothetical protein BJY00DRAFT_314692 [Aspergillus carlsbadensis]
MSRAEPTQPLTIAGRENEPVATDSTHRTLVTRPLSNFDYTSVSWRFDILRPCGFRNEKLRDYREQAATVLGEVYERDAICRYFLGRMSQDVFRTFSESLWLAIIRAALLQGATLYEANNFKTIAIVFPPGRSIDQGRMRRCALNGFKDIWRLTGQNGEQRLLDGYCRVSREMRSQALGHRGGYCIFALGTIHANQTKGLARTLITKLQEKAYEARVPLWIETAMPRVRDMLKTLGFTLEQERHVGMGECTEYGTFVNGEPLIGVQVFGMIWHPRPGPYLFIHIPAEQKLPPPASHQPSVQGTPPDAIFIPEGSRPEETRAERRRSDTSVAQSSAVEPPGDEEPATGPLDFHDRAPLLQDLPSQAIETCSTAPVSIKAAGPLKARRGSVGAGPSKPGPSTTASKADRDAVYPDKGLESALFGEGTVERKNGEGEPAKWTPQGENGHSQPASDESSNESYATKHFHPNEDLGEEDIDTRKSVQQEIDTLR